MDVKRILAELSAEREQIDRAITALESLGHVGSSIRGRRLGKPARRRRRLSAAGRKRISEAVKAMWARRRKKAGKASTTRHMSAATRKRLSELAKQRWAARKKKMKTA